MSLGGYIKLHRDLLGKAIWKNSTAEQKVILITLLMMANHSENEWEWSGKRFKAKPGQFVTSEASIVEKCGKGVSRQNVRTALKKFENYNFLTRETTKKDSLITIINWGKYQHERMQANQSRNQQLTNSQPSVNQQLTTNKNVKNDKNVKKRERGAQPLKPYGEFGNVLLKEGEYEELIEKYPKSVVDDKIANLDCHIQNGERKYTAYKDHYATIGNWCRRDTPVIKPDPAAPYGRDPETGIPFANGGLRK